MSMFVCLVLTLIGIRMSYGIMNLDYKGYEAPSFEEFRDKQCLIGTIGIIMVLVFGVAYEVMCK